MVVKTTWCYLASKRTTRTQRIDLHQFIAEFGKSSRRLMSAELIAF